MRNEPNVRIDKYRFNDDPRFTSEPGYNYGVFMIKRNGVVLKVIAGYDGVWEHVSVSVIGRSPIFNRCATWEEMCFVKDLFWHEDETVIQFHPKKSEYINLHEHVLHLWKKVGSEYELPRKEYV